MYTSEMSVCEDSLSELVISLEPKTESGPCVEHPGILTNLFHFETQKRKGNTVRRSNNHRSININAAGIAGNMFFEIVRYMDYYHPP